MAFSLLGTLGTTTTEVAFELLAKLLELGPVARPHRVGKSLSQAPPDSDTVVAQKVNFPVAATG